MEVSERRSCVKLCSKAVLLGKEKLESIASETLEAGSQVKCLTVELVLPLLGHTG